MDIRRENCVAAFEKLGMTNSNELLGEYSQKGPFRLIEEGELTPAQWRTEMRRYLSPGVTDQQIDAAFIAFLIGIPQQRLRELEELHKRYKIYMLSNTNPVMWDSKIADEFRKEGHDREYYFDGIVTSFEAKAMKPSKKIFETVIEKFGIKPEETLFFDDSQANISAADEMGFKGWLVKPGTEFIDAPQLK